MQDKTPIVFPKLAIVGKGAIGGLIGFKCHQLGYDYQHLIKIQQQQAVTVTDISGVSHNLTPHTSVIAEPDQFDLLILPVKAYQVLPVLVQLQPFIQPQHIIMLLHNGMGTIEQVRKQLPNNPLIAATTSYGAFKPDVNRLIETGLGQTHLGWLANVDTALKQSIEPILSKLLPPSKWHQDINLALWKKLAINAVINPLTAIHNLKNGELADIKYSTSISNICDEIAKVMSALGYLVDSAELVENVQQVITATANNYSSMHQDIKFKRQTEIAFINGYVTSKATELNIEVPHNLRLVEQVRRLE
ncbi:ketopantoate reductase family protein [Paraglaciecola arctica]|uniref:2-dehydropantoate 2-reductase n=1 Tax=Paraglaciecola arctica BSs20135 TaxID=493475 RepID=K6YN05_9ALTE|nr:2-dehydropantoate 2-reductase [Paraglaciecola arctica]GAC18023.1 2-dehydropantoate 2-reductase [Paraglaciecola arctica BSs20135]